MYHFDFEQFVNEKREEYIKMVKEMFDDMEEKKTYEQGLADAWEVLRKLQQMPCTEFYKLFPCCEGMGNAITELIRRMTPAEAIAKIKAYEEKQDEIKVGDEITDGEKKCVVVERYGGDMKFNQSHLYALDSSGRCFSIYKHNFDLYWKKTGKHFLQIEELLKAMKNNEKN